MRRSRRQGFIVPADGSCVEGRGRSRKCKPGKLPARKHVDARMHVHSSMHEGTRRQGTRRQGNARGLTKVSNDVSA